MLCAVLRIPDRPADMCDRLTRFFGVFAMFYHLVYLCVSVCVCFIAHILASTCNLTVTAGRISQ